MGMTFILAICMCMAYSLIPTLGSENVTGTISHCAIIFLPVPFPISHIVLLALYKSISNVCAVFPSTTPHLKKKEISIVV